MLRGRRVPRRAVFGRPDTAAAGPPVARRVLRPVLRSSASMVVVSVAVLVVTAFIALQSARGQRLDRDAMEALSTPQATTHRLLEVMSWVSVGSVALALAACVALALARRRLTLALAAMVLVAGANVSTQLLKFHLLTRRDVGLGTANSLPSGHTTVAMSLALAAVLVAPPAWRGLVTLLGSGGATLIGAGTVIGRWHKPGDVVAGVAVCLFWAAVALTVAAVLDRHGRRTGSLPSTGPDRRDGAARPATHLGALLGAALVGVLVVSWGVRPTGGLRGLELAVSSLAVIGLACAISVGWVSRVASRSVA